MPKYFCTTAIDYINARPHIGHALEKIGTDVAARYRRLRGDEVYFLIGTDEHSLNIQRQAEKEGVTPRQYCDRMVVAWKDTWKALDVSYDGFIRTTDPQHEEAVDILFRKIHDAGYLYEGDYEGLYCASCENYYTEKDSPDLQCPTHKRPLEKVKEKNFFFKLSAFQEPLQKLIESEEFLILPVIRRNEILGLMREGLQDVSFTRSNVKWGVPCPLKPEQTIWIWFDALINYISAIGYGRDEATFNKWWPAQVHVIGKDITRFHCLIWPAMLLAAGVPLPKQVFVHGFVSFSSEKMSKTRGNVVEPSQVLEKYPADVLRYYLLREVPFNGDGDFTWERLDQRYNSDLANDLGNLVNRSLSMINRYRNGKIPNGSATVSVANPEPTDAELKALWSQTLTAYTAAMDRLELHAALAALWSFIGRANQYVEQTAPWALAKDPAKDKRLDTVLYNLAESCRLISVLLTPFIPATADKIRTQLNLADKKISFDDAQHWGGLPAGAQLGNLYALFPRETK